MARTSIFVVDTIGPALDVLIATAYQRAESVMQQSAAIIQADAQANAPWTDRTGEARSGLTAEVYNDGGELVLELYHTAEHGEWLEIIQDGRFAIIMPTLEAHGGEILAAAGASLLSIQEF